MLTIQALCTAIFVGVVSLGFSQTRVGLLRPCRCVCWFRRLRTGCRWWWNHDRWTGVPLQVCSCWWWWQLVCSHLGPARWSSSGWWQAWENLSIRHCRSFTVCEATAASSAKSMLVMMVSHTLVFALSLVALYSLPSDLVCMSTPPVEFPKAYFRRRKKRMPKRVKVGARTQPCLTPLLVSKGLNMLPSYWMAAFISSWKDLIVL